MFMFEKLCRLCITENDVSSTLNNSDSDNITILDKLNRIAPGLLKINSSLPTGICTKCIAQLNQACKFIKNCFHSQEILNQYLKQLQNGLDAEQNKNYEIVIINEIKLEQNNAIIDMEIEPTNDDNTLANYEEETNFIKQENIILEYSDGFESFQVNFEDEETKAKMAISEEECNYFSIDVQSNRNVKAKLECSSDIKNEIIEEHLYEETDHIDYECTEVKFEDEIKLEDHDSQNSFLDIPTITEQSHLYGFKAKLECSNDIKNEIIEEHLYEETDHIDYECTEVKFEDEIKLEDHDSQNSFLDIPTITEQSHLYGFNSIDCSLANDIKVKYNFELNRFCEDKKNFQIKLLTEEINKFIKNDALKRSRSSKNRSDAKVDIRSDTIQAPYMCNMGEKPFQCKTCKTEFARKEQLTAHIRTHTGERRFQCKMCKKSFAQKGLLTAHIRTHTGERPFQCKTCKTEFARKEQLTAHIRTHTGERRFQCKMCKKSFAQKGLLTAHIRTHTGERPFQCKMCKKAFVQKGQLTAHIRTHTGERPFQCKMCKKAFAHKCALTNHIRTHTGEKPYQCKTCKKAFIQSSNLNRHIKTHTN